jgi:hypothetical protein
MIPPTLFCDGFCRDRVSKTISLGLALNCHPPDLCPLSSLDYRCETPVPGTLAFFFAVLRLELRAYTLSHSTSPIFVKGFFEIGSHELFVQAGFKL